MKTLDARPVCWLVVWWVAALGAALLPQSAANAGSLRVQPAESLSTLREKLASDASITEVVFEAGRRSTMTRARHFLGQVENRKGAATCYATY